MSEVVLTKPTAKALCTAPATLQGAIIGLYGDVLQGWAMDSAHPDQRLVIEICIDDACVALVRAEHFQPSAEIGDQFHGFSIQLRQSWMHNARHISARIANQNVNLKGDVSLPATPNKEPAPSASQVWHSGGLHISGWAWDPEAPRRHVQISVRENSHVLARASCDTFNLALVNRESSNHGFSIDLPWELADGQLHTLHIENDLGQPVTGSPIKLCCWPEGLEGLLKQYDLHGPDDQTLALLTQVAKEQTLRSPKSAGFQHYPHWFEVFQHALPKKNSPCNNKVGLLLISDGDLTLEGTSLASLRTSKARR